MSFVFSPLGLNRLREEFIHGGPCFAGMEVPARCAESRMVALGEEWKRGIRQSKGVAIC